VAEWVEDEETAALLAEWGVDYLQGRHCGEPILTSPWLHEGEKRYGPDRPGGVAVA